MILVDTSVWIAYFRTPAGPVTVHLQELLEEDQVALAVPVKMEILSGSPARDWARLHRVLGALPLYFPSDATWTRMEGWIRQAVSNGERFGVADLLIASLAADRGAALWSLDSDFARMERLGFVRLHAPC